LLVLLIVRVLWSEAPQPSYQAFITRELIVLASCLLAVIFSALAFRSRSRKLKTVNITTVVFTCCLQLLMVFVALTRSGIPQDPGLREQLSLNLGSRCGHLQFVSNVRHAIPPFLGMIGLCGSL